jgi:hypothetical protein
MDTDPFKTQLGTFINEFIKLLNMGMDVPIRKEAYEMDGSALSGALNHMLPEFCLENLACLKGPVDQTGALVKYPPCSQGIVTHFAVAHIFVAWESHNSSVSL